MSTHLIQKRSEELQKVATFTGEGAYHGATRPRESLAPVGAAAVAAPAAAPAVSVVAEMAPTTLDRYDAEGRAEVGAFLATFPNAFDVVDTLPIPSQEEIIADEVTFCWSPLSEALALAGPLTRRVLEAMQPHLRGKKQYIYIDSKIQRFEAGDLPVDSQLWHVDGTITERSVRAQRLGYHVVHDMRARMEGGGEPPQYLAYQSSMHCATEFAAAPVTVTLPEVIPSFDGLDAAVRAANPPVLAQPASSIVRFDGLSLHRAVRATASGWRLWVRCVETDRVAHLNPSLIACYGTVFRTVQP